MNNPKLILYPYEIDKRFWDKDSFEVNAFFDFMQTKNLNDGIKVITITYKKLQLKNSGYNFIFVQEDYYSTLKEVFNDVKIIINNKEHIKFTKDIYLLEKHL